MLNYGIQCKWHEWCFDQCDAIHYSVSSIPNIHPVMAHQWIHLSSQMHLGLNMPNIFCMNAFGIYVNKAMGQKNIQTHNHFDSSSCQSISMSASTIVHMHRAPQQSWQSLPVPLLVAIVERVSMVPSVLAQISHVPKAGIPRDHISCWCPVEHSPCILYAPHLMYISVRLWPVNTPDSQTIAY
jgi:hypothetical protein